jgi:hypothetical protein
MSKKTTKGKKFRPLPKPNRQIPISQARSTASIGINQDLQNARDHPIYGCWIMEDWESAGLAPVVVARQQAPGRIMFGLYLVDLYCLGMKDAFTRIDFSLNRFERELPRLCSGAPEKCSIELAHEIIYGALEYAEKLGFQPHPDFKRQMADLMLDPPEAHPRLNNVPFGKDGKPLFITGPNDDDLKIASVLNTLKRTCGEGNFDYLFGFGEMPD